MKQALHSMRMTTRGDETEQQARFQALMSSTHQRLYRFVRRSLRHPQDAEDVTQETLMRAWTHFDVFDAQRSFEAWVFRIAANLIIDLQRRKRRRSELPLDAAVWNQDGNEDDHHLLLSDSTGDPEACLLAQEFSEEMEQAVRSLSPDHQAVLQLMKQNHSYEHMSRALDCPLGTIRSRVHRARVQLSRNLKTRLSQVPNAASVSGPLEIG